MAAPSVGLIVNANDSVGGRLSKVVRLSTGKYFAIRPLASNPFYYSADGVTWTNLTHTPALWITSSATGASVCVDWLDRIYVSYTHDNSGANNGRIALACFEYSGATPTTVANNTWIGSGGINSYTSRVIAIPHPDGTANKALIVVVFQTSAGSGQHDYSTLTLSGTTLTLGSGTNFLQPGSALSRFGVVLHSGSTSPLLPASATLPVISIVAFNELSGGGGQMYRRSMVWNGVSNFTVGTQRNTAVVDSAAFHQGFAYTGSECIVVYNGPSAAIKAHRFDDGSAVTATLIDPPTTGKPAAIDMVYLAARASGEVDLYLADAGVAGLKKSTYSAGAWSAYTTILAGAGEIDNFQGEYAHGAPSATSQLMLIRDEAGATDQIYMALLSESFIVEDGSEALVEIGTQGDGEVITTGGAEAIIEVGSEGAGEVIPTEGSEAAVEIVAEGGGELIPDDFGGAETIIEIGTEGSGFEIVDEGSEVTVTVGAYGAGFATLESGSSATVEVGAVTGAGTVHGPALRVERGSWISYRKLN